MMTDPHWLALRECWLDLEDPRLQSLEQNGFSQELRQRHKKALNTLLQADQIDTSVAQLIGNAFEHLIDHVQQSMSLCYIAMPAYAMPRGDLMQQLTLLEEMATQGAIEPETVSMARAALERNIAWLAQFESGETPGWLEQVDVAPSSAEAARILVGIFLGQLA
jgi:hypothetical protein